VSEGVQGAVGDGATQQTQWPRGRRLPEGQFHFRQERLQEPDVAQLPWRSCVKWTGSGEGQGAARFSRRTRPRCRSKSTG